ncbi:hypothetical protein IA539_00970 [Gordonia sp. zg691]|uniref:hypothetical protein n=1 Tax=Gordonia jinghuaiqii TaxID=2758710 RepID=UPI0016625134|nr:hypothetical protein [Gordonia jinghuaiqii]MBD0859789.1 hypothetical protein [Gordonia jinghuaiqii]
MFRLRHPFSGHVYSALDDGDVLVEKDGRSGVFDRCGHWRSGEIRSADAEMCRWMGTHHHAPATRHRAGFEQPADRPAEQIVGQDSNTAPKENA